MLVRFARAETFLEQFDESLSDDQAATVNTFVRIPTRNIVFRLLSILKNSVSPSGFWGACLYVFLLSVGKLRNAAPGSRYPRRHKWNKSC